MPVLAAVLAAVLAVAVDLMEFRRDTLDALPTLRPFPPNRRDLALRSAIFAFHTNHFAAALSRMPVCGIAPACSGMS